MLELNKIYNMDCVDGMKLLDDESVDAIITSPPYWQKRDYKNENQIGLEENYNDFIDKLFDIFKESKRILKNSGSLWIVISDSYSGNKIGITDDKLQYFNSDGVNKSTCGITRKSLMMIPERLAIKMIDDGWVLRNKIIWHKPNAMPESIKDRFSVDYEQVYFFTKKPKYKFNQQKEKMKTNDTNKPRGSVAVFGNLNSGRKQDNVGNANYTGFNSRYKIHEDLMRNVRSVWEISTESSEIEHFAMFPESLCERMILSSTNDNDLILDMFMGAGTTAKMARLCNRNFIGFEISKEYCEIANKRIAPYMNQISMFDNLF